MTSARALTCEEYFCHNSNICPQDQVQSTSETRKCPTSYTGENCECPPIFVFQKDESGNLIEEDYVSAHEICRSQDGYIAFFINEEEYNSS